RIFTNVPLICAHSCPFVDPLTPHAGRASHCVPRTTIQTPGPPRRTPHLTRFAVYAIVALFALTTFAYPSRPSRLRGACHLPYKTQPASLSRRSKTATR